MRIFALVSALALLVGAAAVIPTAEAGTRCYREHGGNYVEVHAEVCTSTTDPTDVSTYFDVCLNIPRSNPLSFLNDIVCGGTGY